MRLCRSCNAQFPDTYLQCIHCGGSLSEGEPAVPEAHRDEVPPDYQYLTERQPSGARELLGALSEAGIEFIPVGDDGIRDVDWYHGSSGHCASIAVYVKPADFERAFQVEQSFLNGRMPSGPARSQQGPIDPNACPACGAILSSTPSECLDCGLVFPEE